jgi:cytochrome c oxidase subunit 2
MKFTLNLKNFSSLIFLFLSFVTLSNNTLLDAATPWQLGMQSPATPLMEGIINFHNHIMFFLVGICIFVFYLLARCISLYSVYNNKNEIDNFTHATTVEIVWTVVPAMILMVIAVPSFALLYSMDEMLDPAITLKVVGHQWYWSYEYSDYNHLTEENTGINFDSYMIADDDLTVGSLRLLEVDNRVVLPANTHIRVLITAADVLHSWAIPSFGVKVDACPGRLNQTTLFIKKTGVFYGQCSELCGTNHGFMPICVEAVNLEDYTTWLENKLEL